VCSLARTVIGFACVCRQRDPTNVVDRLTTEAVTLSAFLATRDRGDPLAGGKVCFVSAPTSTVSRGNYTPVDPTVGTPFSIPTCYNGAPPGQALARSLKGTRRSGGGRYGVSDATFIGFRSAERRRHRRVPGKLRQQHRQALAFCGDGNTRAGTDATSSCTGVEGGATASSTQAENAASRGSAFCTPQCKVGHRPSEVSAPGSPGLQFSDEPHHSGGELRQQRVVQLHLYRGTPG
jgi:hypothetical protein